MDGQNGITAGGACRARPHADTCDVQDGNPAQWRIRKTQRHRHVGLQSSAALGIFVITIALSLFGLYRSPRFLDRSLFRPYWFFRRRQFDTVVLSGLMHADLMHLIFNMMTFYFFAFALERYIGA